jgi:uncharacterized protein
VVTEREENVFKGIISVVQKYFDPSRIILFGSRSEGKARRESDFDIAIDNAKPTPKKMNQFQEDLDKVTGLYSVDVIYLREVTPEFRNIVLETGKVIYERKK